MKARTFLSAALAMAGFAAQAQTNGTVNFCNNSSNLVVFLQATNPVAASNGIKAALYWAPVGSNTLVQIGAPVAVGVPLPGIFAGGTRMAGPATPGGAVGQFQVRAWGGPYATYEQAVTNGAPYGSSTNITMPTGNPVGAAPTPPTSLAAYGLVSFSLVAPPVIIIPPTNQTVHVGSNVLFAVVATGAAPLSYQWIFNGTNLPGATASTLTLTNVQVAQAGNYAVLVTNTFGSAQSSNALLTVLAVCTPVPSGLVGWWRGENNTLDEVGITNGTLVGDATYSSGEVGQGFIFDGTGDAVSVGNPPVRQLQNFTIEAWIKRGSATIVSPNPAGDAEIFAYGFGGYGLGIYNNGKFFLSHMGISHVDSTVVVTDTNFHHVAVTKSGNTVVFYVDGVANLAPAYGDTFTFTTVAMIGNWQTNPNECFLGTIDEASIYNRPLSAAEILAIYNAGSSGKCLNTIPPVIVIQPTNQTVMPGSNATFSVVAAGSPTLSYQWQFQGTNVVGATKSSLTLTNVYFPQAGNYSVLVTNAFGSAQSSNALLTVLAVCTPVPSGLVGWWRGENNALDALGIDNGTLAGNTTFAPALVGQGFVFDGTTDGVQLGTAPMLQLQNFTIETWFKRSNTNQVTGIPGRDTVFLSYGTGGYGFGLNSTGHPLLTQIDINSITGAITIADTNFHHLAVTKLGTTVVFYVDAIAYSAPTYSSTFSFTSSAAIGARGDTLGNSFLGALDEISVYNRALSGAEIQAIYYAYTAGKCPNTIPPVIVTQPTNQTVVSGSNVTFLAVAAGSPTLNYQWLFNSTNIIAGATNSSLSLSNLTFVQAGSYSLLVTNAFGFALSSNAVLTVSTVCTRPPAGLIGWWKGENNGLDSAGTNNAYAMPNIAFTAGVVGQAFACNQSVPNTAVHIADQPYYALTNSLSIEAWIRPRGNGYTIFWRGDNRISLDPYVMGMEGNNFLDFGITDANGNMATVRAPLVYNQWWHVAGTLDAFSGKLSLYTNGTLAAQITTTIRPFGNLIPGDSPGIGIGNVNDNQNDFPFLGDIDEIALYDRALTGPEIQAIYTAYASGKCLAVPPIILSSPTNQVVPPGSNAVFTVLAAGSPALNYQWLFNGTNLLDGAHVNGSLTASLTILNLQTNDAGNYQVIVTNAFGSVTSAVAALVVGAPPQITVQPTNQTVFLGSNAVLTVVAIGSPTLFYQWQLNGTNLAGATNGSLVLTNLQFAQTGNYAVLVTNAFGSVLSSNAVLTVTAVSCVSLPAGLVGWWRGEGNTLDSAGTNNGTLVGNTTYGAGLVGQAFVFDGTGDAVSLGSAPSLQLQNFTIEAWIKRGSASIVSPNPAGDADLFAYGYGGYGFGIYNNGIFFLTRIGIDNVSSTLAVTDTNFHHVAVTKSGSTVVFYVDGVSNPVPAYGSTFTFTSVVMIGAWQGNLAESFLGTIDETSVYNRALSAAEIQAIYNAYNLGKCVPTSAAISVQPTNQAVLMGSNATFVVSATGTAPLTYQWWFNATNLLSETSAMLTITNAQFTNIGGYSVVVTNIYGGATSVVAALSVGLPPLFQSVAASNGMLNMTWNGATGFTYQVQYKTNLNQSNWINLGGTIFATSGIVTASDTIGTDPQRFYRVALVP